jgi:cell wall-associated NlpC family hydrolase
MSAWSNAYIGIPYSRSGASQAGVNCWTLVALIYAEQLGIALPTYLTDYTSMEETAEISALVDRERGDPLWLKVDVPHAFDVALFRRGRVDAHVGIVVVPGLMLHVTGDEQSKLESYATPLWRNRLTGFYRHVKATSKVVP